MVRPKITHASVVNRLVEICMRKNIELNIKQINIWSIAIWLLGGNIAFALIASVWGDFHLRDALKVLCITIPINNVLYRLYLSIPFLALAVLIKLVFRKKSLPEEVFFPRVSGIVCSFIIMEWFHYAYSAYLAVKGNMFSVLTALYGFIPFVNLLLLPIAYLIGYLVGIFINKWIDVENISLKDLK